MRDVPVPFLGDAGANDPATAGSKAANLSRLAGTHPVPPGFVLTTALYEQARDELDGEVPARPPAWLTDLIGRSLWALTRRCGRRSGLRVAVRSSAVGEDGAQTSFAGQHDSFLGLEDPVAVAEAVVRCWSSASSERAQAYRRFHGIAAAPRVAVLVQAMCEAESSAIVFSLDPVTGATDRVTINAALGLGEALVKGLVTPDVFSLRKPSLDVLERKVGMKDIQIVARPDGRSVEQPVPRPLRDVPCLSDEQVRALGVLAITLEEEMGWPVDLECSFAEGALALLQCRPVTARR